MKPEEDFEDFPVAYSIDNEILMHRDAHFGGSFPTMIDYYQKEGKGVCKDFTLERIEELAQTEKAAGTDLSPAMLSGADAEKIADSRKIYQDLRTLCENSKPTGKLPRLIAELILSEEEETPAAIQAVVAEKSAIVPLLIDLLRSDDFYDSLFPGYGEAPALAAECLGMIGDKRAIISLFEAISSGDFANEEIIFNALKMIGEPAKEFLLKVLHAKPITTDNEQAAVALIPFKDDSAVASFCLKMLQELDLKKYAPLATYLVLACEGLSSHEEQQALLAIGNHPDTPKSLIQDIKTVAKTWH